MTSISRSTAVAAALATAAAATMLLLAGCTTTSGVGASPSETPSASASPTPSVTVDPEVEAANEVALAFLEVRGQMYADTSTLDPDKLHEYAFDEAYKSSIDYGRDLLAYGYHHAGSETDEVAFTEQVASGDWEVWVCYTRDDLRVVDADGKTVEHGDLSGRREMVLTVKYYDDFGYRVISHEPTAQGEEEYCQW